MRLPALVALTVFGLPAEKAPDAGAVVAELGRHADKFELNAFRVAAVETFRQVVPNGIRSSVGRYGTDTALPGFTREIMSEYGFITEDVRGGSLREVRRVLTIDGLQWNKATRDLAAATKQARKRKNVKTLLEDWEDYGLHGFVTDLGQLILLFARGNTSQYDIRFAGAEGTGPDLLWVYNYDQRDGDAALSVYGEAKEVRRERLHGKLWVDPQTLAPARLSLESEREDPKGELKDVATVSYYQTEFDTLMPIRIVHQQYGDDLLLVTNEFTYAHFKRVLPPSKR